MVFWTPAAMIVLIAETLSELPSALSAAIGPR